ncbi:hypothetical protein D3C81_1935350 [compost metagenome]
MSHTTEERITLADQQALLQLGLWNSTQANASCGSFLQQRADDVSTAHDIDFQLHTWMRLMEITEEVIVNL